MYVIDDDVSTIERVDLVRCLLAQPRARCIQQQSLLWRRLLPGTGRLRASETPAV